MQGNNRFTSKGCSKLKTGAWPQLMDIEIGGNSIEEAGAKEIIQSNWNLKKLELCIGDHIQPDAS